MLKLVVTAPGKLKAELECSPDATFGDVKRQLQEKLGVPTDKQRLLCNGRERKDAGETLTGAGVGAKSKLMLMLAPGYTMPAAPPAAEDAAAPAGAAGAQAEQPTAPKEAEGELPWPGGATAGEGVSAAGTVHVRRGRDRYHVRVPQGLAQATFGQLAEYLAGAFLGGVPASELRFLAGGRTPGASDALGAPGAAEAQVMLLFREGFHTNADSAIWLRDSRAELKEAEEVLERLGKRIEANFSNEETALKLAEVGGVVATLRQSVDSVRVFESSVAELQQFREQVIAAEAKAEALRKSMRL
ncbi:unnamed protein product [Prorocentrum cordatum]|uniref:Ubiquitin-like domain-containing protein n=1 Tax=Prorocentrum cordatum TaxID=2364126 RepID=A0ABN9VHD2_9DINO|nr:unnamed protein product [Polarella glacialis]